MIDLDQLRSDTPACQERIHFNNAGASLMPDPVYRTVVDHLALERDIGGYEAAALRADELEAFYRSAATLLRARPEEIAYVENATRAWDMAFYSLPLESGDRILTHGSEYASNFLAFLQLARRRGVEIDVVPSDQHGQLDLKALRNQISRRTRLIAITHVPSQSGLINPAEAVGRIAQEFGITYLLDACQSLGQLDVDVGRIGCDLLSGTGRKFLRGPRGTGLLYVSSKIIDRLDPPFIDLHAATWTGPSEYQLAAGSRRFENWESYVAGRLGLARAMEYAMAIGLPDIEQRVGKLAAELRTQLASIDGITVHDLGERLCGIVTFGSKHESASELAQRLRRKNINLSVTPASYAQLDLGARGLPDLARASVHYFNTEAEIQQFCEALDSRAV